MAGGRLSDFLIGLIPKVVIRSILIYTCIKYSRSEKGRKKTVPSITIMEVTKYYG
jgi:hypothetical protein